MARHEPHDDDSTPGPSAPLSTGKLLWEFPTNSGILAPPSSFIIDGKQYIAVNQEIGDWR